MSLKPTKKSDAGKDWMRNRRASNRKLCSEYHLIITEGKRTEPEYFRGLQRAINSQYGKREKIRLEIHGEGVNTIQLVQEARKIIRNSATIYSHVWIVYDTDDFPAANVNQPVDDSRRFSNDDTTYHAIWSNQCIELWFLLHFSYIDSDLCRDVYGSKLTAALTAIGVQSGYHKGRPDMFEILRPYIDCAIRNAKKLDDVNKGKQPSNAAPGTKVYEVIDYLWPYLSDQN